MGKQEILQQWLDKGVLPRYPNELAITNEDMKTALSYAKSIQDFVMNIFNNSENVKTENN
jgi:glycerol dehydrogenase-like iron-containing ADH family enzyme